VEPWHEREIKRRKIKKISNSLEQASCLLLLMQDNKYNLQLEAAKPLRRNEIYLLNTEILQKRTCAFSTNKIGGN
jgi:hypothetical protein